MEEQSTIANHFEFDGFVKLLRDSGATNQYRPRQSVVRHRYRWQNYKHPLWRMQEETKKEVDSPCSNALVSEKGKFLQNEAFKKKETAKQAEAGAPGKAAVAERMKWLQEQGSKKEETKKEVDSPCSNALVSDKANFLQTEAFKKKENENKSKLVKLLCLKNEMATRTGIEERRCQKTRYRCSSQ